MNAWTSVFVASADSDHIVGGIGGRLIDRLNNLGGYYQLTVSDSAEVVC